MEKENVKPVQASEPSAKKRRLSLSLSKKKKNRFADIPDDTLESMASYHMPKNSAQNSKWALNNLKEWFADYNQSTQTICVLQQS